MKDGRDFFGSALLIHIAGSSAASSGEITGSVSIIGKIINGTSLWTEKLKKIANKEIAIFFEFL